MCVLLEMKYVSWCSLGSAAFSAIELRALGCKTSLLWAITSQVVTLVWLFLCIELGSGKRDFQGRAWDKSMYTCIHTFLCIHACACVWLSEVYIWNSELVRVCSLQRTNVRSYWTFIFSFLSLEQAKEPGRSILFTQPCCNPEQEQLWPMQAFNQKTLMIEGGSGQTGLPSRVLDLPSTVLIRSLCQRFLWEKISHQTWRQQTRHQFTQKLSANFSPCLAEPSFI